MPSSPAPPIPSSPPLLSRPPSLHPGRPQRSLRGLGAQTPACPGGWLWATPSAQQVSTCPTPGPAEIEGLGERGQGHRLMSGRSLSPSARAAGAPHPRLTGPPLGSRDPPPGLMGPPRAHRNPLGSQDPPELTGTPWAHGTPLLGSWDAPGFTGSPRTHGTLPLDLQGLPRLTGTPCVHRTHCGLTGSLPPGSRDLPPGSRDPPWAHRNPPLGSQYPPPQVHRTSP